MKTGVRQCRHRHWSAKIDCDGASLQAYRLRRHGDAARKGWRSLFRVRQRQVIDDPAHRGTGCATAVVVKGAVADATGDLAGVDVPEIVGSLDGEVLCTRLPAAQVEVVAAVAEKVVVGDADRARRLPAQLDAVARVVDDRVVAHAARLADTEVVGRVGFVGRCPGVVEQLTGGIEPLRPDT